MKRLVFLATLLATLCSCGGAAANSSPANAQQVAQQVVTTAADAWNLAASTCLAVAGATDAGTATNPTLAHDCALVLQPVHDVIIEAQVAASVWDAASQKNFPCLIKNAGIGLANAAKMLRLPVAVADAALIATQIGGACVDGGAS